MLPGRCGCHGAILAQGGLSDPVTPLGTTEAVDIKTALRSYTLWAARSMFLEDRIGSIEVGKDADLAVWDRNPYQVPTAALKDMRCELTLVRGKTVYRAESFKTP